jgi:ABC-type transport system involved in Fe-S cluster assembly fused permease/ATPase subunit
MMYTPIKKLSRVNANLQQAIAASERIFDMLDTHSEVRERPQAARRCLPLRHSVEFRRVSFGYDDGDGTPTSGTSPSRVRRGQIVAIVGLSGAGKTTLVNLIPRFYDVTGGAILVDGVDIRDVTLRSLRAQIGIVTQETVLFDDTIAANIAYGTRRRRGRRSRRRRARRTRTTSSSRSRADTTPPSASAARSSRAGSGSGSRSPGRCSRTRLFSSSTRRPRRSTPSPSSSSRMRWRT